MRRTLPAVTAALVSLGVLSGTAHAAFQPPQVAGSFGALRVRFTNTTDRTIDAAIAASDAGHPYRALRRSVQAGQTVTVTLRAPAALKRLVARKARRRAIVRRPTVRVMDLATNQSVAVVPRINVARSSTV